MLLQIFAPLPLPRSPAWNIFFPIIFNKGRAISKACEKIGEKGKKVAAHMLEAKPEDIEFKTGELIVKNSSLNVKRAFDYSSINWTNPDSQDPYLIMDCQEIKTTWHPIGY